MTNPYFEEDNPYMEDDNPYMETKKEGVLSRFFKNVGVGAKQAMSSLASPGALGPGGVQASYTTRGGKPITREQIAQEQSQFEERVAGMGDPTAMESTARFLGNVGATLPLNAALGGPLSNVGRGAISKALGPAATKAGAFAKGVASGLPGQVVGGVATTALVDPNQVMTVEGLAKTAAYSTVGGIFDGIFGVRDFNNQQVKSGIESFVEQAPAGTAKEVRRKIDEFMEQFDKLADEDPKPFTPKKPVVLEKPDTYRTRDWQPDKKIIPNSDDVQGYSEKIAADMKQRDAIARKMRTIMEQTKKGWHDEKTLARIPKLQQDFDKLTEVIAIDLGRLGKSAEDVRNLMAGGGDGTPRTRINIREQKAPNFTDPIAPNSTIPSGEKFKVRGQEYQSPSRPGSGTQSPYAYIPPEQAVDPLAPVLAPKKLPQAPTWLNDAEKEFYNKIDVGNQNAAAMEKDERYLLDTMLKRVDYKMMDFLRPVKEASKEAYDYASKFLRINMRAQAAIDDALYIPNGDGTYRRGAEGLVPMARKLGGDPEQMLRLNMYSQARQAASGVETPFDATKAQQLIDDYAVNHPEIVEVYENMHKPLMQSMRDAALGYGLTTQKRFEALNQVSDYVAMFRSAFDNTPSTTGFLKGRKNPGSEKLVGDYWLNGMSAIRGLVRAGERANVLRELAKARLADPNLAGAIDIIDYVKPEEVDAIIAKLPKDIPEQAKQAFADMFGVPQKGNVFPVLVDGKMVSVRLNNELASSLDMMQFRGPKTYNPENISTLEKLITRPAEGISKTEKAITGAYSVYRDFFGFGIPLDAIQVATNASSRGMKFNLLTSPVKGLIGLYNNDPVLKDLMGHGAGLGFRYANPMAEAVTKSVDDLQKLGKYSGLKLRLMNPKEAFFELTGNISNASRAGLVLANKEMPMNQLATAYNDIIGDPAKTGAFLAGIAKYTGFMNYPAQATKASVYALDNIRKNPANAAFYLAKAGGQLVAPTIILYSIYRNNPQLRDLAKDPIGRRYIPLPNPMNPDEPLMLPKPQGIEGALFVTLPQMLMEELEDSGNTEVMDQVIKAAIQNVMPNPMPLTFNMALGMMTGNTIDPSGIVDGDITRSVVPRGRENLMAEDAGSAGASQTSQLLAGATGVAAGKWERVLRTFLIGTSYDMFRGAENLTLDETAYKPTNQLTPLPGIRKTDASTAGNRYLNEFYKEYEQASKVLNSVNRAMSNGQVDKADKLITSSLETIQHAQKLAAQKEALDAINEQINVMKYNEFYSTEEKTAEVRRFNRMKIDLVKDFLDKK